MKRTLKSFFAVLLATVVISNINITAFAADSKVTFKGATTGFEFKPGSNYTQTDLFDNFKNVMPGDTLTETVTIENQADDCAYINVYMKAIAHDDVNNAISYDEEYENTDGKDGANIDGKRDETLVTMADFLSKLNMTVSNGDTQIYNSSLNPNRLGTLADNVFLGKLEKGESLTLDIRLSVPATLDNKYANRVGEIDWVFLAECIEYEKLTVTKIWEDNEYPRQPNSVKVHLLRDNQRYADVTLNSSNQWSYTWDNLDDRYTWTVEEEVPGGYEVSYKTEGNTVFITNYKDYTPEEIPKTVDLTVKKVWVDDNNKNGNRPSFVSVTLYNGDKAEQKVILNESNNWTYIWHDLSGYGNWKVLETGIPKGYTPSYSSKDGIVTITNTATLIHTGQLSWPIPVFGGRGIILLAVGIILSRKKNDENA